MTKQLLSNLKLPIVDRKGIISTLISFVALSLFFNQSIFILVFSIAGLAVLNLKSGNYSLALSRAVMQTFASVTALWLLLSAISVPFEFAPIICFVLTSLLLTRYTDRDLLRRATRPIHLLVYLGPIIYLVFVLLGEFAYSGNLSWAMAGDSRNHISWIVGVAEANGILKTTYPYLPHGFIAALFLALGENDLSQTQQIIFLYSRFWILVSILFSLMSALIITDLKLRDKRLKSLALVAVGLVTTSSLLLENSIENGFLITVLPALFLVCLIPEFLFGKGINRMLVSILCTALITLTFPTLALIPALSTIYFTMQLFTRNLSKYVHSLELAFMASIGGLAFLSLNLAPDLVRETLALNGRVAGIGISISIYFVLVILASNIINRTSEKNFGLLIFAFCTSVNLYILSNLTDRFSYYFVKSLWIATSVLAVAGCIALAIYASERKIRHGMAFSALMFATLVAATNVPIKFQAGEIPSVIKLSTGGDLISPDMGNTILKILDSDERSISWNLYPIPKQQVTNIWEALGYDDDEEIFLWSYSGDVTSLDEICRISEENSPSTIFVSNTSIKDYVEFRCGSVGLQVKSLQDLSSKS
jgi:hypothetical protein